MLFKSKIVTQLRKMEVGEILIFNYPQYPTLKMTIARLKKSNEGLYRTEISRKDGVFVKRIR